MFEIEILMLNTFWITITDKAQQYSNVIETAYVNVMFTLTIPTRRPIPLVGAISVFFFTFICFLFLAFLFSVLDVL